MARFIIVLLLCVSFGFGAKVVQVDERYQSSQSCKTCHKRIVDEWSHSWHARSHYKNDEYFRKSIEYVSRKTRRSLNGVKVQCATCHNPRISVTKLDDAYEIAAALDLDDTEVTDAVNDESIAEGINCVVCHNINKIHDEYDATKRGIDRVEWTPSGTMTGPYKDAKSPYHKVVYHDFMDKTPNRLCFVCHANDRSVHGVEFTNMEKEYKGDQKCVDCHMGPRRKDVAATYKFNGKAKIRDVRSHNFMGAHFAEMWQDALKLSLKQKGKNLQIEIKNPQPHNIPSGFGGREILVEVVYNKGGEKLKKRIVSLTRHYMRKKARASIPHTAKKQTKDMSIPAKGKKVLKVAIPDGATDVEVTLYYRLVNMEIKELLDLEDSIWCKKQFIAREILKLK